MAQLIPIDIHFFETQAQFRLWLEQKSETARDLWVGYYKKESRIPSITWPQSVDEALCFGWIDGIRKTIDDKSYTIRFTPRNPKSVWSSVNIKKVEELTRLGLMKPAGLKVFEARSVKNSEIYSFEQNIVTLEETYLAKFRENKKAWEFFSGMPPSYRKIATWWVISAKQEATRLKRLEILIGDSEAGLKIALLRR